MPTVTVSLSEAAYEGYLALPKGQRSKPACDAYKALQDGSLTLLEAANVIKAQERIINDLVTRSNRLYPQCEEE
jgi:hypothetical protein